MVTPKSLPSFVRTGATGLDSLGDANSKFIKLTAGKPVEIVPLSGLDGVISYNQHALWLDEGNSPIFPCFAEEWCPGDILGDKPRFRALLLCVVRGGDSTHEEMILPMGIALFKQLVSIEEAIGESIRGHVIRITRTGERLSTRYNAVPTGRRVKLSGTPETNLLDHIGVTDPNEVVEMLEKTELWTDEHQHQYDRLRGRSSLVDDDDEEEADEEEAEEEKPPAKKSSKKSTKGTGKPAASEEFEEFFEDEE